MGDRRDGEGERGRGGEGGGGGGEGAPLASILMIAARANCSGSAQEPTSGLPLAHGKRSSPRTVTHLSKRQSRSAWTPRLPPPSCSWPTHTRLSMEGAQATVATAPMAFSKPGSTCAGLRVEG